MVTEVKDKKTRMGRLVHQLGGLDLVDALREKSLNLRKNGFAMMVKAHCRGALASVVHPVKVSVCTPNQPNIVVLERTKQSQISFDITRSNYSLKLKEIEKELGVIKRLL